MAVYNSGSEQLSIQIRAVCVPESASVISMIAVRYLLSLGRYYCLSLQQGKLSLDIGRLLALLIYMGD